MLPLLSLFIPAEEKLVEKTMYGRASVTAVQGVLPGLGANHVDPRDVESAQAARGVLRTPSCAHAQATTAARNSNFDNIVCVYVCWRERTMEMSRGTM